VETTAKSVEEAKEAALDQLGVDESDAEFEVVEEPKPGLFGRMRGEARVRARVRPTRPRPKVERRDRRRKASDAANEGAAPAPARKEPKVSEVSPEPTAERDAEDADRAPARSGGSNGGGAANQGAAAAEFLVGLAKALGVDGVTTRTEMVGDNEVEVRLQGSDLGLLIGPRGQTLQAVQDLTRLAVQRHDDDRSARLRIDIAGYRERRREALARFTEQVVAQVVATGEARALEPMSAADRKVVHDVVNTLAGVSTRSEGEDPFRRVVITPADG
jgi:spoIIIJ-associated protein